MYQFTDFEHHSQLVDDNEFFAQYLSPDYPWRYDSNFFLLKFQPDLQEFKLIEEMQIASHRQNKLSHLKFYWPQNTPLTPAVTKYLDKEDYGLELLDLYRLKPGNFKDQVSNLAVKNQVLSSKKLGAFKSFNYQHDQHVSKAFAQSKLNFYDDLLAKPGIDFLTSQLDQEIIASLIQIEKDRTIEIDDLYVHPNYRHQKIASTLVNQVADYAKSRDKDLILLADGEDSVGVMYTKLGFSQTGSLIGASKKLSL